MVSNDYILEALKKLVFASESGYTLNQIFAGKVSNNLFTKDNNFCYIYEAYRLPDGLTAQINSEDGYKLSARMEAIYYRFFFNGYAGKQVVIDREEIENEYINPIDAGVKVYDYIFTQASMFLFENYDKISVGIPRVINNETRDFDRGEFMQTFQFEVPFYVSQENKYNNGKIEEIKQIIKKV